ncbi:hypothetical protein SS50377_20186 [Spironucleus salmonicida]|uniref:Uncharacterized protein n=1 Tax=Spironucleus salmonicida TaxID=348837 RepID=V6LNE7_9EUKA|nr:hypothetical protein SS50377_20186 [Spironucleus salmonicida]|eukprot:EST45241.1 hypothetical protein SS50377_14817 [Spironucleus salmonicida]
MQSEIRKILELADSTTTIQSKPIKKQQQLQKLPQHPLLSDPSIQKPAPSFVESHVISIKADAPFADCEQILQIYTPTTDSPDELKQKFQQTISLLQPPVFPLLDEDHYYEYICVSQKQNPRITYEQMVEVVDLASICGFNFIVVADRLKHRKLDPIICMNTFLIYCEIQASRKMNFNVEESQVGSEQFSKAIQTILFYNRTIVNFDQKTTDELERQQTVRETWACFSPLRIAQKRFSYVNGLLTNQLGELSTEHKFDFSGAFNVNQIAVTNQNNRTLYQIGQNPIKQTKSNSYKSTNLAYNQQLNKSRTSVKPQISTQILPENITVLEAIERSKIYIDAQVVFSQEPSKQELDELLRFYNSTLTNVDYCLDGFESEGISKLAINNRSWCSRGSLACNIDSKKEPFLGHCEIDFDGEIENFCTSASWRWSTEKIQFDGNTTDAGKLFAEDEKYEQKINDMKYKKGMMLRKRICGKQIGITQFFALENLYK